MASTSSANNVDCSPLRLYAHVVPSAAHYCEFVRRVQAERSEGNSRCAVGAGRGERKRVRDDYDSDEEKENKVNDVKRSLSDSSALDYDPSRHAKLLMLYSGGTETVKDLREDVLERYKKSFGKVRKVAYIDLVFDRELFALADEYRLRDCFQNGGEVILVGTRTRVERVRRPHFSSTTLAHRNIVKKEISDDKQAPVGLDEGQERNDDGAADNDETEESDQEVIEETDDDEREDGEDEEEVVPTHQRAGTSHQSAVDVDENTVFEMDPAHAEIEGNDALSRDYRNQGPAAPQSDKVPHRKKRKISYVARAVENDRSISTVLQATDRPSPMSPFAGSLSVAKKPRKKAKVAAEMR